MASKSDHPNVFVRGLPLQWSEEELIGLFQQFGPLSSLRLVRHSITKHSLGYGFVRYQTVASAQVAISALDRKVVAGHMLQVKFADADAGLPTTGAVSGLTPSDTCYVKHLPSTVSAQEVCSLFATFGHVVDAKLFPCLDSLRGASAVVRMASAADAERAISGLNNTSLSGTNRSLVVRFAESSAEKAARLQRRKRHHVPSSTSTTASSALPLQHEYAAGAQNDALAGALASHMAAQFLGSLSPTPSGPLHASPPLPYTEPPSATQLMQVLQSMVSDAYTGAGGSTAPLQALPSRASFTPSNSDDASNAATATQVVPRESTRHCTILITGLPRGVDRLWLYEQFAPCGAVVRVKLSDTGDGDVSAIVEFSHEADAKRAVREQLSVANATPHMTLLPMEPSPFADWPARTQSVEASTW